MLFFFYLIHSNISAFSSFFFFFANFFYRNIVRNTAVCCKNTFEIWLIYKIVSCRKKRKWLQNCKNDNCSLNIFKKVINNLYAANTKFLLNFLHFILWAFQDGDIENGEDEMKVRRVQNGFLFITFIGSNSTTYSFIVI